MTKRFTFASVSSFWKENVCKERSCGECNDSSNNEWWSNLLQTYNQKMSLLLEGDKACWGSSNNANNDGSYTEFEEEDDDDDDDDSTDYSFAEDDVLRKCPVVQYNLNDDLVSYLGEGSCTTYTTGSRNSSSLSSLSKNLFLPTAKNSFEYTRDRMVDNNNNNNDTSTPSLFQEKNLHDDNDSPPIIISQEDYLLKKKMKKQEAGGNKERRISSPFSFKGRRNRRMMLSPKQQQQQERDTSTSRRVTSPTMKRVASESEMIIESSSSSFSYTFFKHGSHDEKPKFPLVQKISEKLKHVFPHLTSTATADSFDYNNNNNTKRELIQDENMKKRIVATAAAPNYYYYNKKKKKSATNSNDAFISPTSVREVEGRRNNIINNEAKILNLTIPWKNYSATEISEAKHYKNNLNIVQDNTISEEEINTNNIDTILLSKEKSLLSSNQLAVLRQKLHISRQRQQQELLTIKHAASTTKLDRRNTATYIPSQILRESSSADDIVTASKTFPIAIVPMQREGISDLTFDNRFDDDISRIDEDSSNSSNSSDNQTIVTAINETNTNTTSSKGTTSWENFSNPFFNSGQSRVEEKGSFISSAVPFHLSSSVSWQGFHEVQQQQQQQIAPPTSKSIKDKSPLSVTQDISSWGKQY